MHNRYSREPGLLEKIVALVAGAILLVVGFMFSLVLFAVIVSLGLLVWGYLWWRTRKLRRALREQQAQAREAMDGRVIEGEAVIVEAEGAERERGSHRLPPGGS
jgi:membrane protein implicated in regulation of membrane protease activity